ncbi:MAG: bifunctional methylenetetrahydrofolate dehydrogenase/methenyltetrahydrofolate cyclohydrolase FolD [Oceanococcaceae bacterium]
MRAKLMDGKALAARIRQDLAADAAALAQQFGRPPGLAVVLVGADPASQVYVRNKERACAEAGFYSEKICPTADVSQQELEALVDELNAREDIDGILVQLPLPRHLNAEAILDRISPAKDVDGFHPENIGRLLQKRPGLRPCTPYGVMRMLEEAGVDPSGQRAVVVGASNIVGRPMAMELLLANATVTICNSRTRDVAAEVGRADIVVAGVGIPEFVKGSWIKPGATVVDVGINRLEDGRLVGDVEFDVASLHAGAITPVPGGVGPMTIAMLLHNTLLAMRQRCSSD